MLLLFQLNLESEAPEASGMVSIMLAHGLYVGSQA